jgi:pyruvate/2-oxoglutarate dehydrogenase complex dihydrolipoamide acyltransferase (E2) component
MTTTVKIPKSAMGIEEATVLQWFKAEGDRVTKGEVIVEIETAKANLEVESPVNGVLQKILLAEGETAEVRSDLAIIDEDRE